MERKILNIGGEEYVFNIGVFDEDIDVEKLLKIDYANLVGEVIFIPFILHKIGVMLSECDATCREIKINLEIYEAKVKDKIKNSLTQQNGKPPTVDALNTAVTLDKAHQSLERKYSDAIRNKDYMQSLYWSLKDKSDKLSLLLRNNETLNLDELISKTSRNLIK